MKRLLGLLLLLSSLAAARTVAQTMQLPKFPLPALVENRYGDTKRIGFLHFLRQLQDGGVQELDDVDFLDENYAELTSLSLPALAAWLEAACGSVGVELRQSRLHHYDGMAYAQLLEVATSLAAAREIKEHLAMPIGVLICRRRLPWGDLPGDGARDAYLLIATERGLLVYDPPTRQIAPLPDFPNSSDVYKIQF